MSILGGYGAIDGSAAVSGGSSSGRDFIDKSHNLVSGTISGFSIYINSIDTGSVKLKVWRQSGTDLVLVGNSSAFSVAASGKNDFTLLSGINCETGDYVGVFLSSLGIQSDVDSQAGSTISYKDGDNTGTQAESGFSTLSNFAMCTEFSGTLSSTDSILISYPSNNTISQRSSGYGTIFVSGAYTGSPTAIQARIVNDTTLTEVLTWNTLDSDPSDGLFSGTLTNVPEGGWYNVQVRFSNDINIADENTNRVGVGCLIAFIGQSNAVGYFTSGSGTPNEYTSQYNGGWIANSGYGAVNLANGLHTVLGVPVGLINSGVGSTRLHPGGSVDNWLDLTIGKPYSNFIADVNACGGACEFVLWIQGEQDAYDGDVSKNEYKDDLQTFFDRVRILCDNPTLPILISLLGRHTSLLGNGNDATWDEIRQAQLEYIKTDSNSYIGSIAIDLPLADNAHWTSDGYLTNAMRMLQTIKYINGNVSFYRCPRIFDIEIISESIIDIILSHFGGSDFTPTTNISGFSVYDDDIPIEIGNVTRQSNDTIRISLSSPATGSINIKYLYGANPDISNIVIDNSTLPLPLEPSSQSEIDAMLSTLIQLIMSINNDTTASNIAVNIERSFTVTMTNQSITSEIQASITRLLQLAILNNTNSSNIAVSILRSLSVNITNQTLASDINILLANLIQFGMTVSNSTALSDIISRITRGLTVNATNDTDTSDIDYSISRAFITNISNSTDLSEIDTQILRSLSANITNQTVTPDTLRLIMGVIGSLINLSSVVSANQYTGTVFSPSYSANVSTNIYSGVISNG